MTQEIGWDSKDPLEWRDTSPENVIKERNIKIGLVAAAILLAVGVAICIYFCATTSTTFSDGHVRSNIGYSFIPGSAGVVGTAFFLAGAYHVDYEPNGGHEHLMIEGYGYPAIKKKLQAPDTKLELVYQHHYLRGGGLRALVRNNVLTPGQGKELSALLVKYDNYQKAKTFYSATEGLSTKEDAQALEAEWNQFKQGLGSLVIE